MEYTQITYEIDEGVATIALARPQYRNAQSWRLLDELDAAFEAASADNSVRVIILRGSGGNFSAGHDLGTPEQAADREERAIPTEGIEYYNNFRWYNLETALKWRNVPKPTIAMVEGWCINGGWEIASAMDVIFADEDARFITSQLEYFTQPWDLGFRKAKEILFELRVLSASEAMDLGFVNRVLSSSDLERETYAYARRCAENPPELLRMAKIAVNRTQDIVGFSNAVEAGFSDYMMKAALNTNPKLPGSKRMLNVDQALRHMNGERYGQGATEG